mgnify:CR=1 FL=1
MAKYILSDSDNNYKLICDSESKDWYLQRTDAENATEISDEDATSIFRGEKILKTYFPVDATLSNSDCSDKSFSKSLIEEHIVNVASFIREAISKNANAPSIWTTKANTLEGLNLSSLDDNISGINWPDALANNSVTVPLLIEFSAYNPDAK